MNSNLFNELSKITEEEQKILDGQTIDMSNYSDYSSSVIDSKKLLESGKLITIRPNTRFTAFPKHSHNYVEMVYMVSGEQTHIINDDTKILLKKGELLLLNRYTFHEIKLARAEDIAVNFIVLPQFFDTVIELIGSDNKLSEFLVSCLLGGNDSAQYMHFNVADVLPVQNLLENLTYSIVTRQPNRRNINQVTMGLLFLQLLNCTDKLITNEPVSVTNSIVVSALKEIEENYRTASLSSVARVHNVTIAYVSRIIKDITGKTFKELLQEKRLSKATALLKGTKLSINEIITIAGYENTSYFYKLFTEKYKVSPKKWRDENSEKSS